MTRYFSVVLILFLLTISAAAQSQTNLDEQVKPIVASFKGKVSLFAKNLVIPADVALVGSVG
jgi:hypothetical protein